MNFMTIRVMKINKFTAAFGWFLGFWFLGLCPQGGWSQTAMSTANYSFVLPSGENQPVAKASGETPMIATAVAELPSSNGLGPVSTSISGSTMGNGTSESQLSSSSTNDFSLSPEEEAKILSVIDAAENTMTAAAPVKKTAAIVYVPPPVPTGLSIIALKEGVYLSWDTAPATSSVAYYNVYRSTTPGMGYKLMNSKPLNAAYFLDGPPNSNNNPQNGEDYFYVVAAVDGAGNISPYSDEETVTPSDMDIAMSNEQIEDIKLSKQAQPEEEKILNVPDQGIISLKLPADSQLAIQGYKKVEAQIGFQTFSRPDVNGLSNQVNTTTINQELVVNLKGKVGKNVDVNVDYSDVNRAGGVDQTKQDISIVYHGDPDSAVQQVSFGDLQLSLPNTDFAGFSKQLFGLEAVLQFDRFKFTSFFAQTKGVAVTKVFTGNTTQVDKTYQDIAFVPLKYFLITRAPGGMAPSGIYLPQAGSEQIWVNAGSGQLNPVGTNFLGVWEHWLPGRDYTIDYTTGIITFVRALSYTAQVAVGFNDSSPNPAHGLNISGYGPPQVLAPSAPSSILAVPDSGIIDAQNSSGNFGGIENFLIKDSTVLSDQTHTSSIILSPLYLVNYFSVGTDRLISPQQDPGFLFQIVSEGTNNIVQTGQGGTAGAPYAYNLNLDLNVLSITNINYATTSQPYLYFPERPFANQDGVASGTSIVQAGGTGVTDVYAPQGTTPTSLYYIHLRYKTQLTNFQLGNINILRGSEQVYLDGRLLTANKDYFIDYTSGFLDFQDKSLLTPSSQIVVSYEYAPFGSFGAENILGARAEYAVTDNFFIGSTFLYSSSQTPTDIPQIGSTPNSLTLFDADAKYEMDRDALQSITGIIPGLEKWKPPADLKLSGEIAQSYFDPDTYNINNENGVAMVDNMEGIDNAISASLNQTSWLVSSAPEPVQYLGGQQYIDADIPANNRIRFYDDVANPNVDFMVNTSTAIPGGGGHVYAQTGQASDVVNVLQFPYAHLTSSSWAGLRQVLSTAGEDFSTVQYFQTWLYNDGKPKWIMFDFGVVNESSNGDNLLDSDSTVNQANPNQAYGIPTFYMPGTPWYFAGLKSNFNYAQDAVSQTGFIGLNGEVSQEGQNNAVFITQNMDGTGVLNTTDSYFEYGVNANWTGWQLVKIPVNLTSTTPFQATAPGGISYFYNAVGSPNSLIIRTLRLWITGEGTTPIDGNFVTDSISFSHNLWQLEVDPAANANLGVTINTSKFDANSISQAQNSNYQPDMSFVVLQPGQDQTAIQYNQKALDVTYQLSSNDYNPPGNINGTPIYYTTRVFSQGLDFTDYQELRMNMNIRTYNSGDVFFVRIGNDQQDYYQYNIPINSLVSNCLDIWGTVIIPIDGSGGNRVQVGTPFINRATQMSFGVLSPNPPGGHLGEMWIDYLRAATPNVRSGTARRLNAELALGDDPKKPFATIDARYREVDSGFTELDQSSTHFQHSLQYGLDYTSNGISLFGKPLETQFSFTDQELYTEAAYVNNPYYIDLPNSLIDTATSTIRYTHDFGKDFGRLTSLNLSGSLSSENDVYQQSYLNQAGVQGNTTKDEEMFSLITTYDMPTKLWFVPIGTNQLTETYSLTHDGQSFDDYTGLANYQRTTRVQNYGWTNTTEIFKNLVFTPGFNVSLTDAKGNTDSPGVSPNETDPTQNGGYMPFIQQYEPKAGLVFRGIPGIIPSVTYTGSNQYDYVDYSGGTQFTNSNNLSYLFNVTPGSWLPIFQKMNLTVTAGRTESSTAIIPGYSSDLSFDQQWWISSPNDKNIINNALSATQSTTDQLNASFKLFDVWDFRPTGSWTNQYSLLYAGSAPSQQSGDTLGLTTIYNRRLLTIPLINLSINSVQVQFTRTDSTELDSASNANVSIGSNVASQNWSNIGSITFPYDINKSAQGNIRFQATVGYQNGLATTNIPSYQQDYQGSIEYDQKFAPNLVLHIPLTHWRIQLHDAIEFKANFLTEIVQNDSSYSYNQLDTQRYRATIEFDYNALKNLRIGLTGINEYFTNTTNILPGQPPSPLDYVLWQINLSGEAKF
jgi:hypothetical protein